MTGDERQRAMDFIRDMNARTDAKLQQINDRRVSISSQQARSDKRWKETENRIRALLIQVTNRRNSRS